MAATLTTEVVQAYHLSWHRKSTGAEWDICPECSDRIGLEHNVNTEPVSDPDKALFQAVDLLGGDESYYCPECGRSASDWGEPVLIQTTAVVEHFTCKIF